MKTTWRSCVALLALWALCLLPATWAATPPPAPLAPLAPAAPIVVGQNFSVAWGWNKGSYSGTLTGFHVKWGSVSGGPYPNGVDVLGATNLSKSFTNFALGDWFMVITAYDSKLESGASNELALTVAQPIPAPDSLHVTGGQLVNLSTRATVGDGEHAMIAGFIALNGQVRVAMRGIGPSLPVDDRLSGVNIELHDANGALLASNNGWRNGPDAQALIDLGLAPGNDRESALIANLDAGPYTSIVRGDPGKTGIGLVEIYALQ